MTITAFDPFVRYYDNQDQTVSFSFRCFDVGDVLIILDDGTTATEYNSTDFTITLNADQYTNPGGTVDFGEVPASPREVYIGSNIEALQETDMRNATSYRASVIENWMDRMTMIIQQVKADYDRCLKIGRTTSGAEVSELIDTGTVAITLYMQSLLSTIGSAAALLAEIGALADTAGVITESHIANSAVTVDKINDGTISTVKLADGILSNDADGRGKMAAGFLSANSAGRSKMADGFVTEAKLDPAILAGLPSITMYTTATDTTEDASGDWLIAANNDQSASFVHNLGARPNLVVMQLVCVADTGGTSHGYSVDDAIDVFSMGNLGDAYACDYDATRIVLKTGAVAINADGSHAGKLKMKIKGLETTVWPPKEDFKLRAVAYLFGGML